MGKFAQRAGVMSGAHAEIGARLVEQWQDWLPRRIWEDVSDAIGHHHWPANRVHKRIERIVRVADRLAAGERQKETVPQSDLEETPLVPVLGRVKLAKEATGEIRGYALNPLSASREVVFPQVDPSNVNRDGYARLWQGFARELARLAKSGTVDNGVRLATLLALLRKYLWCVPSATPWQQDEDDRVLPDVSLYDHPKVTAAIATCLEAGLSDDELDALHRTGESWNKPIAVMVRGDFSGIQSFIYRVTRPEADATFEHVAKRLRGRSFHLGLLGQLTADHLARSDTGVVGRKEDAKRTRRGNRRKRRGAVLRDVRGWG